MSADPNQLRVLRQYTRPDILFSVAGEDLQQIYVGSSDARIYELELDGKEPRSSVFEGHRSYVTGLALRDGVLVSASYDGDLIWWDVGAREAQRKQKGHGKWIRDLRVTPDGNTLITAADDMVCRLWNLKSGALLHELKGHEKRTPHHFPSMLFCTAVSPDNRWLATADKVGHIVIWDAASGKIAAALDAPKMYTWDPKQRIHSIGGIRSLAFSPDGRLLAAGGIGQIGNIDHLDARARVEIYDWRKGDRVHEIESDKHKGLVEFLAFEPQARWIIAAGGDHGGFLEFIDLASGKTIKQEKAPMHVHDVLVGPQAETLCGVGHGKVVGWELRGLEPPSPDRKR